MAINLDNRVIHRFIQDISAYELGGEYYSQIIPLDTQAYAIYPNEEDNYLFYVIGDGEHTYTELRDGKGNGPAYKEYPVLTTENLDIMIGGVEEEARRRKEADNALRLEIEKEVSERKEFDELLDEALGEEIQNRESSENAITESLNSHIENKNNPHEVTAEQIGLGNVDNTSDLDKPISTATQSAIDSLLSDINDEITARELSDELLKTAINNEETRAKDVENFLQSQLDEIDISGLTQAIEDEIQRAINVETDLQTAIESEETRATQAESLLSTAISSKQDQLTEPQLQAVNSGVTNSVVSQVNTNKNDIQNIYSVIPNAASDQNQLADKQFVTTNIARESATFRGTYNSVEELNAYAGDKDNNDYAYVIVTDEVGNQSYNAYKYNGNQWVYEFTLSGSTFTSEQWEAINSGATSNLITQITTNQNAIQQKQDLLVNQENIKSINGSSLLGSGNLEIAAHLEYPSSWPTSSSTTTKQFCDAVAEDDTAVEGKTYLGEVRWNDLPGLVNGEVEVEIMTGTTASSKVIVLTLTSGNKAPYMWKYTYWNGGHNVSGWKGFVPTTNVANKIYGTDSNGNQTTYNKDSFGKIDDVQIDGASVVSNKIANLGTMASESAADYSTKAVADTLYANISLEETVETHTSNSDIHVTLSDKQIWDAKQSALTAGSNIQIENGVISATDTVYTAGNGISIENNTISATGGIAEWGQITGSIESQVDLQNQFAGKIDKYENFPNASELYKNQIAQYIGLSNSNYVNGYFYKCVENNILDFVEFTPIEESSAEIPNETVVSIDVTDFITFLSIWCEDRSFGPSDVTHGDIGIYSDTQYSMTICTNDPNEYAFGVFTIADLEAAGFTFTPPFSAKQGATFICSIDQKAYVWEQINVQPGGTGGNAQWGNITGILSQQTDLQTALDTKANQTTTYTKTEVDNLLNGIVVATVYNYEE